MAAVLLLLSMVAGACVVLGAGQQAAADVIDVDPFEPPTGCIPVPGLPDDWCDLGDPGVDDPNNPCDGLIITGQRRNTPDVVVQYFNVPDPDLGIAAPVSGLPVCVMEQEVIAEIAAERGVANNAEERAEILAFGRDVIRARLFAKLFDIQTRATAGETLTDTEQGALEWAQALMINTERAIAQAALDEYALWKEAPCLYEPPEPHQYNVAGDPGCAGGLAGVFTSVTPPTYTDFAQYGYARFTGSLQRETTVAAAEMSAGLLLASAAAGAGVGLGIILPFFISTSLVSLVLPYAGGSIAKLVVISGGFAAGAAAATVVIIAALVVATIIRVVQLVEQGEIENQLNADLATAQSSAGAIDNSRFLTVFADATTPLFEPSDAIRTSATPDPNNDDPAFETLQNGLSTRSTKIKYTADGTVYNAWLSDSWWVLESVDDPGARTLSPYLPTYDAAGNPKLLVSYQNGQFVTVDISGAEPVNAVGTEFDATTTPLSTPDDPATLVDTTFRLTTFPRVEIPATFTANEGEELVVEGVATDATSVAVDFGFGAPVVVTPDPETGAFSARRQFLDDVTSSGQVTPFDATLAGQAVDYSFTIRNTPPVIGQFDATVSGFFPVGNGVRGVETGELVSIALGITAASKGVDDHTLAIDWGDGTIESSTTSGEFSHRFSAEGLYTITASITDDDGGVDTETITLRVSNSARIEQLSVPATIDEGAVMTVTGRVANTDLADAAVEIYFDDDYAIYPVSTTTGEFSEVYSYVDDAVWELGFTPTDLAGDPTGSSESVILTVLNVAPTVVSTSATSGGATGPVELGGEVDLLVRYSDPGTLDTHTVSVDWGDGSNGSLVVAPTIQAVRTATGSHTYTNSGTQTATITLRDNDGGVTVTSVDIEIIDPSTTTTTTTTTTTIPIPTSTTSTTTTTTTIPNTAVTAVPSTTPSTSPTTTPPSGGSGSNVSVSSSAAMLAGATVDITVTSPEISGGRTYRGVIRSSPVDVGPATAVVDGSLTFTRVQLPIDWQPGSHTVTLFDVSSDGPLVIIEFQVDDRGGVESATAADPSVSTVAPTPVPPPTIPSSTTTQPASTGPLPATGGVVGPLGRISGFLITLGVLLMVLAAVRRRDRTELS